MMDQSGGKSKSVSSTPMLRFFTRISFAHAAIGQGLYYMLGGLWPVFSIETFLMVTGPKTDLWLVKTTGLLLVVIGGVLVLAGIRWRVSAELFVLAVGSAVALMAIELFYVSAGRISPVYLLDAFIQVALVGLWISLRIRGGGESECGPLFDPTLSKSGDVPKNRIKGG